MPEQFSIGCNIQAYVSSRGVSRRFKISFFGLMEANVGEYGVNHGFMYVDVILSVLLWEYVF